MKINTISSNIKIAVVVLNWNGRDLLEKFLPSIIIYSTQATIYVIDNASTDDSIEFIKIHYPFIKIVQNSENFGFAKGYNEGLKNIDCDVYALINSDLEVTPNWLEPIVKTFRHEPKTAIIQPKILDYNRKNCFEYAGAAGGFIDKYGYPFCQGRVFETTERDLGQYDFERSIFWASGACFFIRKSVFESLNGFDDDFFAHQEEIDLCWRAFNNDFEVKYQPKSVVYHVGGSTLEVSNSQKTFLNFRNSLLMLVKNLPQSQLFLVIFVRMILDGIAALKFLFAGKIKHFYAIFRAHLAFYRMAKRAYSKRTNIQKTNYFYKKSIVFQYFIKNQKMFVK